MPSLQSINKRIKSVKAVRKITSAMELVAATKMRRAQETALNSRPYAFTAFEMLANTVRALKAKEVDISTIPLLRKPETNMRAVLLVTSDKGLAGTFNSAVLRKFEQFASRFFKGKEKELVFVTVGEKAKDFAKRRGLNVARSFSKHGDIATPGETNELGKFLIDGYAAGTWGALTSFSTNFVSALKQEALQRELLPIDFDNIRKSVDDLIPKTGRFSELRERIQSARSEKSAEYIIEPSPEKALRKLVPALFNMQIYHLILESNASEHSARRLAMKNASDNAKELTTELTTIYNRVRQEKITNEILEITGGARALAG